MKKNVKNKRKRKNVFNTFSLILLAVVFIELLVITNFSSTGDAIKKIASKPTATTTTPAKIPACVPTKEICDGKDNDCDKLVDEEGVCDVGSTSQIGELTLLAKSVEEKLTIEQIQKKIIENGAIWTARETSKSKLSKEEKKKLLGLKPPSEEKLAKIKEIENSHKSVSMAKNTLPDFFDWRNYQGKNYITSVKDQASCGSCWAFGAVATLESHVNAFYNNPNINLNLSEQDLVSCFLPNTYGQLGCSGAYDYQIKQIFSTYYLNTGITMENCFPYSATNGNCANKCSNWQQDAWKTLGYVSVPLTIEDIKQAVIDHGAVEVGMTVYNDFFAYSGGVYSHITEDIAGYHAVTIVGFGTYDGLGYWIVKNSWGTNWGGGENGYFKIAMGDSWIDSWYAFAVTEPNPPTPQNKICTDNDNDEYCYWGLGNKPATGCPSCSDTIYDCDDNNVSIFQDCGMSTKPTGILSITSTPPNAEVYAKDLISGNWINRGTTPLTFDLGVGLRELKITKDDYEDYLASVQISQNQTSLINTNLLLSSKITFPYNNDIFRKGDLIEIKGRISLQITSYKLEYEEQNNPGIWHTFKVGSSGFIEGTIGSLDTNTISQDGFINIKLTAKRDDETYSYSSRSEIYLDSTLKQGWPQKIYWDYENETKSNLIKTSAEYLLFQYPSIFKDEEKGRVLTLKKNEYSKLMTSKLIVYYWAGYLEPTLGDIDNDGLKELVVFIGGKSDSVKIRAYKPDGSLLLNKEIDWSGGGYLHPPILSDINNDGYKEIIIVKPGFTQNSKVYAIKYNGSELPGFPVDYDLGCDRFTVISADLNLDKKNEIVIQGVDCLNESLGIINSSGNITSKWYLDNNVWSGEIMSTPAVGNFDDDPELEIVVAGPSKYSGPRWNGGILSWNNTGIISIYDINGSLLPKWPKYTEGIILSSPVVGDINKDSKNEIIIGLVYASYIFPDLNLGGLYAYDSQGNILSGWPYLKGYNFWSTPSLGDINGDGYLEIAASRLGFETSLLKYNGSLISSGWPVNTKWNDYYSTTMTDVTGDNIPEILAPAGSGFYPSIYNHGGVYAWNNQGNLISGFPKVTGQDAQAPVSVEDIDNDGKAEIAASSDLDYDYIKKEYQYRSSIYIWETEAQYNNGSSPWPQFHHDAQHTGLYTKPYICGDADGNGLVSISDIVYLVSYIFSGGPAPNPVLVGDANSDGIINIGDAVYLVNYVFGNGPAPCNAGKNYVQDKSIQTEEQVENYLNVMKQKYEASLKASAVAS